MAHKYMNVVNVKKNGFNNLKKNKIMEQTLKKFMNEYKHLQQFYKTKKEFKQHLLSGEVKISIPDMIEFNNKLNR